MAQQRIPFVFNEHILPLDIADAVAFESERRFVPQWLKKRHIEDLMDLQENSLGLYEGYSHFVDHMLNQSRVDVHYVFDDDFDMIQHPRIEVIGSGVDDALLLYKPSFDGAASSTTLQVQIKTMRETLIIQGLPGYALPDLAPVTIGYHVCAKVPLGKTLFGEPHEFADHPTKMKDQIGARLFYGTPGQVVLRAGDAFNHAFYDAFLGEGKQRSLMELSVQITLKDTDRLVLQGRAYSHETWPYYIQGDDTTRFADHDTPTRPAKKPIPVLA